MVTKKGTYTSKELSIKLEELSSKVANLELKIEKLQGDNNKKNVTLSKKDKVAHKSVECKKCSESFSNRQNMINHINAAHKNMFKCPKCIFEGKSLSEIDKHMLENHGTEKEFKCDNCEKSYFTEFRLKKHQQTHQFKMNVTYCHYYNNAKTCPFESFGCKFRHSLSKKCKYMDKCNKKLCQFQHSSTISFFNKSSVASESSKSPKTIKINVHNPVVTFADVESEDEIEDDIYLNQNCNDLDDLICEKYCSSKQKDGKRYHVCFRKKFCELKGCDVKNIGENNFPCNICEYNGKEEEELLIHVNNKHSNCGYRISCLCENCSYTIDDPEEMIEHLKNVHGGLMKNMLQSYISTT